MNPTLEEIEVFVSETTFDNEPINLDQCTIIQSKRKFAESHLNALKANSGKKIMMPYFNRLTKFYNLLNQDNAKY